MKKKMMITMLALTLAIAPLVLAEEAHHAASGDSSTAQMDMGNKMDSSMMEMKEMRLKMSSTEGDSERNKLMHEHMQMMRNGMQMMDMMDQGNMMGKQAMGEKPMSEQMPMMEKKMEMMGGNGMNHMMMEKKMLMMQEMMTGMMTQQEMLMKKK
jgi:hypothetical protein